MDRMTSKETGCGMFSPLLYGVREEAYTLLRLYRDQLHSEAAYRVSNQHKATHREIKEMVDHPPSSQSRTRASCCSIAICTWRAWKTRKAFVSRGE
jgi:hypothetical protein